MKNKSIRFILGVLLTIAALSAIMPFAIMVIMSLTQKTSFDLKFSVADFSLKNYYIVFKNLKIGQAFINSVIVVTGACALNCSISCLAAYAFAKKKFVGKETLFTVYLSTMMIPMQATLIPFFNMAKKLGLMNTYAVLIIPFINAFGVFLIRQFMESIPDDLIDAAKIDGASDYQVFLKVILPLVKPVIISLTIFTFVSCWNDYLWPLVMTTNSEMQTLTLTVATLAGSRTTNYGLVMAGATIAFLPPFILYLLLQKQFVEGIALSGTKG